MDAATKGRDALRKGVWRAKKVGAHFSGRLPLSCVLQVVQAGNLIPAAEEDIPAEEDGSGPRRPKELNCRGGEDAAATPLLDRTSRSKEAGNSAVEAKGERTRWKATNSSEQGLDHEKEPGMERGEGVSTASAGKAAEAGEIVAKSRDDEDEAANDDEEQDDDEEEEDDGDDDDEEAEEEEEEEDASNGFLQLTATRRVPNCCAVCLSGYEVGERVVWSPNRKCRHAFHRGGNDVDVVRNLDAVPVLPAGLHRPRSVPEGEADPVERRVRVQSQLHHVPVTSSCSRTLVLARSDVPVWQ
jgi:hypothetical protein